ALSNVTSHRISMRDDRIAVGRASRGVLGIERHTTPADVDDERGVDNADHGPSIAVCNAALPIVLPQDYCVSSAHPLATAHEFGALELSRSLQTGASQPVQR